MTGGSGGWQDQARVCPGCGLNTWGSNGVGRSQVSYVLHATLEEAKHSDLPRAVVGNGGPARGESPQGPVLERVLALAFSRDRLYHEILNLQKRLDHMRSSGGGHRPPAHDHGGT